MSSNFAPTGPREPASPGTAAAAVLWAAALAMAREVARRPSPVEVRPGERATQVFDPAWDALLGRWAGDEAAGGLVASFDYELEGGVLTHRALGPAAPGAMPHEVLMTFFPREGGREADAVLFDNTGQALRWETAWSPDGRSLAMTSLAEPGESTWRLTWAFNDPDTLHTCLEAADAAGGAFATRVRALLRRVVTRRG